MISSSRAPSNTGVATFDRGEAPAAAGPDPEKGAQPWAAAHPRCVSRTCPRFIREGTPSGDRMMSTGVPSSRKGMSSSGRILEITPLLPWRPASLSPSEILRCWATYTRTSSLTPGCKSKPSARLNTLTSITLPLSPWGTLSEVSRTSRAFSPKMARSSRSSGVSSVSPLGVTLPTR